MNPEPSPPSSDPLSDWIRARREQVPQLRQDLTKQILRQVRPPERKGLLPMTFWLGKMAILCAALGTLTVRIYLTAIFTLVLTDLLP